MFHVTFYNCYILVIINFAIITTLADEFNLSFKYLANKEYLLDVNLILDIVKIVHKIDKNEVRQNSYRIRYPTITMVNYNNKYHIPIFDLIVLSSH